MIKFGTSGFRGIVGETFTKENVQRVACAVAQVLEENCQGRAKIAVGFDNRFMGNIFAKWLCEPLAQVADILFYEISVPSPLICWKAKELDLGIVLTASHNPYYYNGIKIFLHGGRECDDEFAKKIEKIANSLEKKTIFSQNFEFFVENKQIKLTKNYQEYCDWLLQFVDVEKIKASNLKVLANAMHGNSVVPVRYLMQKLGLVSSQIMNDNIDPYFEHKLPAPYLANLGEQAKRVVDEKYDFGVAFDGDSDRFTFISNSGKIFDCNFVLATLYDFYLNEKQLKVPVIKNKAFTHLLDLIAQSQGQDVLEAKVGFKHVGLLMQNSQALLGAETNGLAFKNHIMSKDGIFAFLAMLDLMSSKGKSFDDILSALQQKHNFVSEVFEFAYPISDEKKQQITQMLFEQQQTPQFDGYEIQSVDREEGCKIVYKGGFWGMIRFSGNEPVVRIFAEMPNKSECDKMFACYEKFLGISTRQ